MAALYPQITLIRRIQRAVLWLIDHAVVAFHLRPGAGLPGTCRSAIAHTREARL
jgi:voltage-gated potassium channel Kch